MWQEDEEDNHYVDNGYIVDVIFRLQGKTLPVNYHFPLHQALVQLSPWLADENIGVHLIIAGRIIRPNEVNFIDRRRGNAGHHRIPDAPRHPLRRP